MSSDTDRIDKYFGEFSSIVLVTVLIRSIRLLNMGTQQDSNAGRFSTNVQLPAPLFKSPIERINATDNTIEKNSPKRLTIPSVSELNVEKVR